MGVAQSQGAEVFLSDASLYLELFGILCISWQWLKQGIIAKELKQRGSKDYSAEFLQSKWLALQYFFEYELPKADSLVIRLKSENHFTVAAKAEDFL